MLLYWRRLVKLITGCYIICLHSFHKCAQELECMALFVQPPCKIIWFISSIFQCHSVCLCDKSAPCCGTPDNQTHPCETRGAHRKHPLSLFFPPPPENKELHFLLANDALIVQVNKLPPHTHTPPAMNNKEFKSHFVCCFIFDLKLSRLFCRGLLHACRIVAILRSACSMSQECTWEETTETTGEDKARERVWLNRWRTVGCSVQYSLCFHLCQRCLWPFPLLTSFRTLPLFITPFIFSWLRFLRSKWRW